MAPTTCRETQARAILDLRLQRLTQIGVKEVTDELEQLAASIKDYLAILRSPRPDHGDHRDELTEVRDQFAVRRRTEIVDWSGDMEDEDLIEREDMVVTVTAGGYIKRTALADFRAQRRGGKGCPSWRPRTTTWSPRFSSPTRTRSFAVLHHRRHGLQAENLATASGAGAREGQGDVNILPIPTGRSIAAIMPVDRDEDEWGQLQIVFATSDGGVRRNALSDFTNVMRNGKIAMKLPEGVEPG